MNVMKARGTVAALLASLGLLVPQAALAAPQAAPASNLVVDVALDAAGMLHGQVVDPQGRPLANTPLVVRQQQEEAAAAVTDAEGFFSVSGLRGGVCQVEVAQSRAMLRVWAPYTAPPQSQRAVMVVAGGATLRGQGAGRRFVIPTLIVGGVIATAIAVPIAVSSANDDGS